MALSRVTTWASGNVLTASALNGEVDNILNNALSLISPLTGNLALGANSLTGLATGSVSAPSLSITSDSNTGAYSPAADTMGLVGAGSDVVRASGIASGVNYVEIRSSIAAVAPTMIAQGSDTNVSFIISGKGAGVVRATGPGPGLDFSNVMLIQAFS